MVFWFIAALLTLAASLAVLMPLAGRSKSDSSGDAHDLEVYRDQLAELDRDAARGLIQPADAEQARAEIARRIIRLGGEDKQRRGSGSSASVTRTLGVAAVLAVPLISWGLYGVLGSPDIPSQPLRERLAQSPADSSVDELIARAEAHLAANPQDGRGWEVLAPVYLRMGRYDQAVTAYRNAIRLQGSTAEREAGLGEAITDAGDGMVSAEAQQAFERALRLEKDQPKARFYLATALVQDGKIQEAASAWEAMLASLPADSAWRSPTQAALAETRKRMTGTPTAEVAPGPTKQDMDAAASMSPEDRKAMIETMVAKLDEKLRQNPHDVEGWQRLLRSFLVLGKNDEAHAALKRGIEALGATTEDGKKLADFAATLGLSATE
ncbi:c-type cytochrome biogenesis protein CcmI [Pseudaminobacter soli (ex Li et al. 2025)]|uniref:C-type cytochrome biogenesis protein CcmI n=1 Tax=Pseudaminobacter soli (ex Li et al. 2025) TaxID=1295366 RepID=A0A2P7SFP8_9HYPH|nr:c-type cytochrome biogenesis protein CcmI [Mesorhizobium soli]PSJ61329.1 c-type cytochrome biogenesis protein CcmI [Mesorhizobium soli]